ncbi:hypothetical protein [Microseira wollei]|uniref:Uncharacterized protein n=1 Tax=Microseira wollei NIES-4236 TaxID=2530354 RepID=A0AAV3XQF9_9CYAN|nr:hypothetical protein [Microseira wollei]GET43004.1 hypothetical protein MiSe_78240 [Microseira wollei NIES-4236]
MQSTTQPSDANLDIKMTSTIPAPGEALVLLVPDAGPGSAYARGAVKLIAANRKAEIEEYADMGEYL